ncbi:hypothetical protein [Microbacterium hominis]|uniref:Uncharacterized protein n=1 Tax=Microbacterium hominis TaxID=162426 RepID=A0A7D4UFG4_9MICO|nr:hypothetical protein [Microbacterium hominis]QKJ18229.1 hypothetical protein HQM25_01640 [Microbacterium hominis]
MGSVTATTVERPPARVSRWVAVAVAAVLSAALVALAVWGAYTAMNPRALIGETISHDGGEFSVVAAWTMDDPMSAMPANNAAQFSAAGMSAMSAMMGDPVPEGMKRVMVQLELAAGDEAMEFPLEGVSLSADGASFGVVSSMLDDERLEPNTAMHALAIFEVPVETGVASFSLGAGSASVAVDVAGNPGGHSGHETEDEDE